MACDTRADQIKKVPSSGDEFNGNFPHQCSIHGAYMPGVDESTLAQQSLYWKQLLAPQAMQMDNIHRYEQELSDIGPITHARLNLHPDGGVSRLRLNGLISVD